MSQAPLRLSVVILCKDEERTIVGCLEQVVRQTLFRRPDVTAEIVVVANGCTDRTAARAGAFASRLDGRPGLVLKVFDLPQGGKSRSWNRAVHDLTDPRSDQLLFLDSDIELIDESVFARLADLLGADEAVDARVGYPLKETARKTDPGLLDRFSLLVSRQTRHVDAICGQLYLIRGAIARGIWLPDETPAEDGFLNAMVETAGFTQQPGRSRVRQADEPTHWFEAHPPAAFFIHERRMIVGTMINRWLFEHLWSLGLTEPAGPAIRNWNRQRPQWVQEVIDRNLGKRRWLIPGDLLFGRVRSPRAVGWARFAGRLPTALASTLLTIPPAMMANATLKRKGAASHW